MYSLFFHCIYTDAVADEYQISADSSFKETINILSARHSETYSCGVRYTQSEDRNCSQTVRLNVYNSGENRKTKGHWISNIDT